ncbi:hypothetical protein A3C18_01960 [Candidatus Kaiserbacteria bacterium RIFCSPHIGHO2_02_FULL_54_11b]|uniref:Methyltransferase domain-containing protein n=2 Tax=Candidatus Kaiseribacteriota TaxID=1752734 RepID=A0A1F6CS81_9BACT|nr:MAG: hypothetical protein A2704_06145 [Candidatus Kaiserbacteria bacterium RIFCSPHIGHO2_01_FULL_54_36b]OGG63889.1 MAG: hypothetical protein A3C18_01960 [Candidatus Kaiserbacteria bacterium RIFCSPHIGHO2_02_FULL_54_11b]
MGSARDDQVFFSLPEIWDLCLDKIYNKSKYIEGLIHILTSYGIDKKSLILDAGCGSGFPALDLVERGYHVTAADKSSEMVRQIGLNAKLRGLGIEARHATWSELERFFDKEQFDLVYCRGNSLVYAASWEQNWIVPARSQEEIQTALRNFYSVLKRGGVLYVDVINKKEKPHEEDIGTVNTKHGPVRMTWRIEHDQIHKIRSWTMQLVFLNSGEVRTYPSYSYLLSNEELAQLLKDVGFSKIKSGVKVKGETNYDVFIARK